MKAKAFPQAPKHQYLPAHCGTSRTLQRCHLAILLLALWLCPSCKKFTEVDPPPTHLASIAVFQSEATANAALGSLYVNSLSYTNGSFYCPSILGAMSSDETDCYSTSPPVKELCAAQLSPANSNSVNLWSACYSNIYSANAILESTTNNTFLSQRTITQLQGEALFFRALGHLTLTSFFGPVPIIRSTDYRENTLAFQSSPTEVLDAVIADLEKAAPLLEADYAVSASERIRANRFAAKALLARAQLYRGNFAAAEAAASEVIGSPQYALGTLAETFLKNSKETILAMKPTTTGQNSGDGNVFLLAAKPTFLAMRTGFYNGFETGDQRRTAWTAKVTVSAVDYFYPYKYKVKAAATTTEYSVVLRLAEMYLIRSEARARQDKLALAIADLDVIRSRAALSKIANTNPLIAKDALLDAILSERRSELFTEWGHRWIDLKRFGRNVQILSPLKAGYQPTAALYPIPQGDINVNRNLVQNPGY